MPKPTHLGELGNRVIFVADSHQNHFHNPLPSLLDFLEREIKEQKAFSLVLMGDIFDMLFGYVESSIQPHAMLLQRFSSIATQRKVIYLEGNHDFNLKPIFKNIGVIPRGKQPATATIGGIKIALAHGDFAIGRAYEYYTTVIRNPYLLYFLGSIDKIFKGIIFKQVRRILQKHRITHYNKASHDFALWRMSLYQELEVQWIFEGHFHANSVFLQQNAKNYIGLPPFSCIQDTFIVECDNDVFFIYSPMS